MMASKKKGEKKNMMRTELSKLTQRKNKSDFAPTYFHSSLIIVFISEWYIE